MAFFTMKTLSRPIFLFLPLLLLALIPPYHAIDGKQIAHSLTPTYDPLAEPPLPEHSTESELGRNLYWHWCMTCNSDRG